MKADMSEAHTTLTKAIDDATSQRDTAQRNLESAEAKLETLKGSVQRFVLAVFGKPVKKFVCLNFSLRLYDCCLNLFFISGKDHEILGESPTMKLTCTFALIKQLFEVPAKP